MLEFLIVLIFLAALAMLAGWCVNQFASAEFKRWQDRQDGGHDAF